MKKYKGKGKEDMLTANPMGTSYYASRNAKAAKVETGEEIKKRLAVTMKKYKKPVVADDAVKVADDVVKQADDVAAAAKPKKDVYEEAKKLDVILTEENLSKAIGRRGQNVRLASDLTKWYIDVISETEESEKRQEEISERTKIFIDALDVDDVIAHLIVAEGYSSISDIAETSVEELNNIEGFDEDLSLELRERAQNFVKQEILTAQ